MFTEGTDRKPYINFTCIQFLDEWKSWPAWQGWTWHLCYNDRWEGKVPGFYVVIIFAFQVQLMYHEGLHDRVLSLSLLTWHALDKFGAPLEENTTIGSNQSSFCSYLSVSDWQNLMWGLINAFIFYVMLLLVHLHLELWWPRCLLG